MAITYRTSTAGGGTSGTGNRAGGAITPVVGDLFLVFCKASGNTNAAPTCSDGNTGGTYTLIGTALHNSSADMLSVFVRDNLLVNTTSTTVTVATGSNTAAEIVTVAVSGAVQGGAGAIRQSVFQANQAASGTPAPSFAAAALTGNMTLSAVGNETAGGSVVVPNASWTERQDVSQSTPTTGIEVNTRDSGFTGTTITYGGTSATAFASVAIELTNVVGAAGSSTGSGSATGAAAAIAKGEGASSCVATVAAIAAAFVLSVGSVVATGTAAASSAIVKPSVASASSSSVATGDASALFASVGNSDGLSTAQADAEDIGGGAVIVEADGSSSGTASASAVSATIILTTGASSGTGSVNGVASAAASTVGAATGSAAASGVSAALATATGSVSSTGNAVGIGASINTSVGNANGTSNAIGDGEDIGGGSTIVESDGASAGSSTISGIGGAIVSSTGSSVGSSNVLGAGQDAASIVAPSAPRAAGPITEQSTRHPGIEGNRMAAESRSRVNSGASSRPGNSASRRRG